MRRACASARRSGRARAGGRSRSASRPGPRVPMPPSIRPGAEPLEVRPQAAHPREVVLELRQLDLELALGAVRVRGEDVEDDRGAVDHRQPERRLEVALLARRELVVAGDEVRVRARELGLQLLELAGAEVACSGADARGAGPARRRRPRRPCAAARCSSARSCSSPSGSAAIRNARWRARPCGRCPSTLELDACLRPWRLRCTALMVAAACRP